MLDQVARRARDRQIAEDFRGGLTQEAVAARHGLSKMRVCQILQRKGVARWEGGAAKRSRTRDEYPL